MKRVFCLLLSVAVLFCVSVSVLAAEQSTCTVGTLDELKTALAASADGDSIAISNCIEISDEIISTDKEITLTRSNGFIGELLILGSNSGLSGFTVEDLVGFFTNMVLISADAENVVIESCLFSSSNAAFIFLVVAYGNATITDSTFQTNGGVALSIPNTAATVTVYNCTFTDHTPPTGESAISNNGTLTLE